MLVVPHSNSDIHMQHAADVHSSQVNHSKQWTLWTDECSGWRHVNSQCTRRRCCREWRRRWNMKSYVAWRRNEHTGRWRCYHLQHPVSQSQADTPRPIPIKFGTGVAPHEVIKISNFCNNNFRGFNLHGVKIPDFHWLCWLSLQCYHAAKPTINQICTTAQTNN